MPINLPPTIEDVDWPGGAAVLGSGIDYPGRDIRGCAVEDFTCEALETRDSDVYTVTDRSSLEESLGVSGEVYFKYGTASGSAKTKYLHEISTSANSATIVAKYYRRWQDRRPKHLPALTAEAAAVLSDEGAKAFRAAYGDYFIAGATREVSLYLFVTITVKDAKRRDECAAAVEAKLNVGGGTLDAKAATEFKKSLDLFHAEASMRSHLEDLPSPSSAGAAGTTTPLQKPEDLPGVFAAFNDAAERSQGHETGALLMHYNFLAAELIPLRADVAQENMDVANAVAGDLLEAEWLRSRLPAAVARRDDLGRSLDTIRSRFRERVPLDLDCDVRVLKDVAEELTDWISRAELALDYGKLWHEVKTGHNVCSWEGTAKIDALPWVQMREPYRTAQEGHVEGEWRFGPTGSAYRYRHAGATAGWSKWFDKDSPPPLKGYRVCGYEIRNNRSDDAGGARLADGGLGQDTITIYGRGGYDRTLDVSMRVWRVPADAVEGFE